MTTQERHATSLRRQYSEQTRYLYECGTNTTNQRITFTALGTVNSTVKKDKLDKTLTIDTSNNTLIQQEQKDWDPQTSMMILDALDAIQWAWILIQLGSEHEVLIHWTFQDTHTAQCTQASKHQSPVGHLRLGDRSTYEDIHPIWEDHHRPTGRPCTIGRYFVTTASQETEGWERKRKRQEQIQIQIELEPDTMVHNTPILATRPTTSPIPEQLLLRTITETTTEHSIQPIPSHPSPPHTEHAIPISSHRQRARQTTTQVGPQLQRTEGPRKRQTLGTAQLGGCSDSDTWPTQNSWDCCTKSFTTNHQWYTYHSLQA